MSGGLGMGGTSVSVRHEGDELALMLCCHPVSSHHILLSYDAAITPCPLLCPWCRTAV